MKVEIEKVVKTQKEGQGTAEVADREEKMHTTKKAGQRATSVVRERIRRESGSCTPEDL